MIRELEEINTNLDKLIERISEDIPTNEFTIEDKDRFVILGKINEVIANLKDINLIIQNSDNKANEALNKANEALIESNTAINLANNAVDTANNAFEIVSNYDSRIDKVEIDTASALDKANTALINAEDAYNKADSAEQYAINADSNAQTALDIANGINSKATEALTTANRAENKADEALARKDKGTIIYDYSGNELNKAKFKGSNTINVDLDETDNETFNFRVDDTIIQSIDSKIDITALEPYATKEFVNTGLSSKANSSDLDNYALNSYVNSQLNLKADKSQLDNLATKSELESKANQSALDETNRQLGIAIVNINFKANQTDLDTTNENLQKVNQSLNTKLDSGELTSALEPYAKTNYVDDMLSYKANTAYVNDELSKKANQSDLDITNASVNEKLTPEQLDEYLLTYVSKRDLAERLSNYAQLTYVNNQLKLKQNKLELIYDRNTKPYDKPNGIRSKGTLSVDFSKYKNIKIYAQTSGYIKLYLTLNLESPLGDSDYVGSINGLTEDTTSTYAVRVRINRAKNLLTLENIGYLVGTSWVERDNQDYYIYKLEGEKLDE